MFTMRMPLSNRTCRLSAAVAACVAAASLPFVPLGCSSSSSSPAAASDAAADATSGDAATADASEPPETGADGSLDSPSADAAPDASDAGDADETGSDAPVATCSPFDASIDGAAVEAGLALVTARNCAVCHRGDFSGGYAIMGAYSKNLTPDPATGLGCWSDDDIATAILYGMGPGGELLCVMPRWSTYPGLELDAATAEQVVQFLRTLPPVSHVVPETDCGGLGYGLDAGDGGDAGPSDGGVEDASGEATTDGGPG